MIAFIGTRAEFENYCREKLEMSSREAEMHKAAIWVTKHSLRGRSGPLAVVDTGTLRGEAVAAAYREIAVINAMHGATR